MALVSGCTHGLRSPGAENVSARGAYASSVFRLGPLHRVETFSILPGGPASGLVVRTKHTCGRGGVKVEVDVQGGDFLIADGDSLCADVLEAILYVVAGLPARPLAYTAIIHVAPAGVLVEKGYVRWGLSRQVVAEFHFPWSDDSTFSGANIVATTAHESFHLLGSMLGMKKEVWADEGAAYLVGYCAQFDAMGTLRVMDLPSLGLPEGSPMVTAEMMKSSSAGLTARKRIELLLGGDTEVRSGTEKGARFAMDCRASQSFR